MTKQLDKVSQSIGSMQSDIDHIKGGMQEMKDILKDISKHTVSKVKDNENHIAYMLPHVKNLEKFKYKAAGFVIAASIFCGIIADNIKEAVASIRHIF